MQFAGAAVVTAGVCTAAWPSAAGSTLLAQARLNHLPLVRSRGSHMLTTPLRGCVTGMYSVSAQFLTQNGLLTQLETIFQTCPKPKTPVLG